MNKDEIVEILVKKIKKIEMEYAESLDNEDRVVQNQIVNAILEELEMVMKNEN